MTAEPIAVGDSIAEMVEEWLRAGVDVPAEALDALSGAGRPRRSEEVS